MVEIGGIRQIGLLAILVAHRGRSVRRELLEDELWGGEPVSPAALRVNIRRLRDRFEAVTGADALVSNPGSYRLDLADDDIDESCFGRSIASARAFLARGDALECVQSVRSGEALWTGDAFEGVRDLPSVRSEVIRLEHLRQEGRELLATGLIELGDHESAIEALVPVVASDPYRESAWALKIVALYRAGRQREALATFEEVRRLLGQEIGIEPGQKLVALQRGILDQVPAESLELELVQTSDAVGGRSPGHWTRGGGEPRPSADRPWRTGHGHRPLLGRDSILVEAVQMATGQLDDSTLVLEGPAGIGKTTLGHAVAVAAERHGVDVAWGSCPRDPAAGMVPVRQILSELLPLIDPTDVAFASIHASLSSTFPGLAPDAGAVAASLSGEPAPRASDGSVRSDRSAGSDESANEKPESLRSRLYSAAEQLLRSVAHPLLVVVDDAQWISEASAELLAYLAGRTTGVTWLVLARQSDRTDACRGFLADMARHTARWHELEPLSPADTTRLVDELAPGHAPSWADVVTERSGGNPFFATEVIRHLAGGGEPEAVPRGVQAMLAGEVRRLHPDAAALVRAVAVAGRPHPVDALTRAAGVAPDAVRHAVSTALDAGLVRSGDRDLLLWPAHDLVRGAVEDLLDGAGARNLHHALADALAEWGDTFEQDRFRHLLEAGPAPDSQTFDELAAKIFRRLARESSPHELIRIGTAYLAHLAGPPRTRAGIEACLQVATAHFTVGDSTEGTRLMETVEPYLRALDDPALLADAILTRSSFALTPDQSRSSAAEGEQILERLSSDQRNRRRELACWVGHHHARAGCTVAARRMALLADSSLDTTSDDGQRVSVLGLEYQVALAVDAPPSEPDRVITDLARLAEGSNDPTVTASFRLSALDHALRTGSMMDYETALSAAAAMPLSALRADVKWWVAAAEAALDLARGDLPAAGASYLHAMSVGSELGVATAFNVGLLQRMLLDWDLGTLGAFHALLPSSPLKDSLPHLLAQGLVLTEAGDLRGARVVADVLADGASLADAGPGGWQLLASIGAEIAWRTDNEELAARLRQPLAVHAGRGLSVAGLAYLGAVDRALGLAAAATGDHDMALDHLHAALEADQERGAPRWAARSARTAADVLDRRGRRGDRARAAALRSLAEDLCRAAVS